MNKTTQYGTEETNHVTVAFPILTEITTCNSKRKTELTQA